MTAPSSTGSTVGIGSGRRIRRRAASLRSAGPLEALSSTGQGCTIRTFDHLVNEAGQGNHASLTDIAARVPATS